MQKLCIFCGSKAGHDPIFIDAARETGHLLADMKITLIYGGASTGIMGEIASSVLNNGGKVIGIMARESLGKEVANDSLTQLILVDSLAERKGAMLNLGEAFIALPGGIGTIEEFSEMFTLRLMGLHNKPCGLLNVKGYFDPFLAFINNTIAEGFMKEKYRSLLHVSNSPAELLKHLENNQQLARTIL